MLIYFFVLSIILMLWAISSINPKAEKICWWGSFIILIMIAGLRAHSVGVDTLQYVSIFNDIGKEDISYVFHYGRVEWGYALYNWIIYRVFPYDQAIVFFNSLVVSALMFRFITKESPDKFFSLFLYITMSYYFYSFDFVRQLITIGIILNGLEFVKNREFLKFLIVILIASTIHSAALFFLVLYIFGAYKPTYSRSLLIVGIMIVISSMYTVIMSWLIKMKWLYYSYLERSLNGFIKPLGGRLCIVIFSVFLFAFYYLGRIREDGRKSFGIFYWSSLISCVLYYLSTKMYIFWRVGVQFSVLNIVLITLVLCSIKNSRERAVMKLIIIMLGCALFYVTVTNNLAQNTVPYEFYWNEN